MIDAAADRPVQRRVRRLAFVAVVGAVAVFVAATQSMLRTAAGGLSLAAIPAIAAGVVLSLAAMGNRGLMNRAAHRAVGLSVDSVSMTRTASIGFAANKIIRSGGASGLAVFVRHGRRRGFAGGVVTASCLIVGVASLAALGALFATTVALLALSGRLSGWWAVAAGGFAAYAAGIVTIGIVARRSRDLVRRCSERVDRVRSRLARRPSNQVHSIVDDLYDALGGARSRSHWLGRSVAHAALSKLLGAAMLLAAVVAAGNPLSPATVVIVYASALAVSFVSFVPGGLGAVELSTGAMLVTAGTPVAAAAVAVALFRIFDLWMPVAAGAVLGRNELRRAREDSVAPEAIGDSSPSIVLAAA